jgi:hypothetical protein
VYSVDADSADYAPDSTAVSCDEQEVDRCMHVYPKEAYPSAKDLASITRSILEDSPLSSSGSGDEPKSVSIAFGDVAPTPTSYCFASKNDLVATLGKERVDEAAVLGRIDYDYQNHCYIALY